MSPRAALITISAILLPLACSFHPLGRSFFEAGRRHYLRSAPCFPGCFPTGWEDGALVRSLSVGLSLKHRNTPHHCSGNSRGLKWPTAHGRAFFSARASPKMEVNNLVSPPGPATEARSRMAGRGHRATSTSGAELPFLLQRH